MSEDWVHGKLKPKACDMASILRGESGYKIVGNSFIMFVVWIQKNVNMTAMYKHACKQKYVSHLYNDQRLIYYNYIEIGTYYVII